MSVIAAAGPGARIQQEAEAKNIKSESEAKTAEGAEGAEEVEKTEESSAASAAATERARPTTTPDPNLGQRVNIYL